MNKCKWNNIWTFSLEWQISSDKWKSILMFHNMPEHFKNFKWVIKWKIKSESLKIKILEKQEVRKGKNFQDSQTYNIQKIKINQEQKKYWRINPDKIFSSRKELLQYLKCNCCLKIGFKTSERRKKMADKKKFTNLN